MSHRQLGWAPTPTVITEIKQVLRMDEWNNHTDLRRYLGINNHFVEPEFHVKVIKGLFHTNA